MNIKFTLGIFIACFVFPYILSGQNISRQFIDPPREFSVMPFWFWNDTLKVDEILRQIKDFEAQAKSFFESLTTLNSFYLKN